MNLMKTVLFVASFFLNNLENFSLAFKGFCLMTVIFWSGQDILPKHVTTLVGVLPFSAFILTSVFNDIEMLTADQCPSSYIWVKFSCYAMKRFQIPTYFKVNDIPN